MAVTEAEHNAIREDLARLRERVASLEEGGRGVARRLDQIEITMERVREGIASLQTRVAVLALAGGVAGSVAPSAVQSLMAAIGAH